MADDVRQWLEGLDLGDYADAFAENDVDFELLHELTSEDVKELGVTSVGHRRKLLNAIAGLAGPGDILDKVVEAADQAEALRRQVTALFADISGFTTMSSGLDAEETHEILNRFFAVVDEVVKGYGGSIDKHIGDAVMAIFGAPVAHTDDPERALRAALDIHEAVAQLNPPLQVHIGVAAGQVVASATGSAAHTEYTVTGDSVNLAARLTDLADAGQTFASASVMQAVGDRFERDDLGPQLIAGMPEPMTVYALTGIAAGQGNQSMFVGRERELQIFEAAVNRCFKSGHGETLIVRGEAGIGKTRLLQEFQQIATGHGFATHTGLVLDFGTTKGQDAVGSLVRGLLNITPNSGKKIRRAAAEQSLSEGRLHKDRQAFLYDLLHLEMPGNVRDLYDAMDNANRSRGKTATFIELIVSTARRTPLLIKLEDLHWADQILLEQVARIAQIAPQHPILTLLTTRLAADPLDDEWRNMCPEAKFTFLDIGPMAASEATDLAETFTGLSNDTIRDVIDRAGGNPLFLEQLLRNAGPGGSGELPGTVQGIVQARLDALAARDRRALQAASILGQRFSLAALGAVMEDDQYRPEELLRQALVRSAGEDFHFAHALIRDGVYGSLLRPQRIALHALAAAYFKESDFTLYARHLDQAADAAAADAYLAAARRQSDNFHYDDALQYIERALELDCSQQTRFELTCLQGNLLRDLTQTAASAQSFERSLETAESAEEICRANLGLADTMRIEGQLEVAIAALDRCQGVAENNGFEEKLAEIHYLRGSLYHQLGRLGEMSKEHEISLKYAQTSGSIAAEARALGGLADTAYSEGRLEAANRQFSRCVELGEAHGLMRLVAVYKPMLATTEVYMLQLHQGLEMALSACTIAGQTGDARSEMIAHYSVGEISFHLGNYADVLEHSEKGLEISRRIGARRFETWGIVHRGLNQFFQNDEREAALTIIREAYQHAMTATPSYMGAWVLGKLALIASTSEECAWALQEGERILAAGAYSHNHIVFRTDAIDACLGAGDWEGALEQAGALETYSAPEPTPWSDLFVRRGRALAAFGLGRHDEATRTELRELQKTAKAKGISRMLPGILAALSVMDEGA